MKKNKNTPEDENSKDGIPDVKFTSRPANVLEAYAQAETDISLLRMTLQGLFGENNPATFTLQETVMRSIDRAEREKKALQILHEQADQD